MFTEDDQTKSRQCLFAIADLYVTKGEQSRDGEDFTKAVGLYNAALSRCEFCKNDKNYDIQDEIWNRIEHTTETFSRIVLNRGNHAPTLSSCRQLAMTHRQRLASMRNIVKDKLIELSSDDEIENQSRSVNDHESRISAETLRYEAVYSLSTYVSKQLQGFVNQLLLECFAYCGEPPCMYAFLGLGSIAREEITPYSDLEFAILIENRKDSPDTRKYFRDLTDLLHIKILNLGETIIPSMYIKSLNKFESSDPNKNWFYDHVTARGLSFDGAMPWACKTPKGRKATRNKSWTTELICTPAQLASFQTKDSTVKEGYKLADVLASVSLISGDESLVTEYNRQVQTILTSTEGSKHCFKTGNTFGKERALISLQNDYKRYNVSSEIMNMSEGGKSYNIKQELYRFPSTIITSLGLYFNVASSKPSDILKALHEIGIISRACMHNLMVMSTIAIEMRLRTYADRRSQRENASVIPVLRVTSESRNDVFYTENIEMIVRFYRTAIPLGNILGSVFSENRDLATSLSSSSLYSTSWHTQGLIYNRLLQYQKARQCFEMAVLEEQSPFESYIWLAKVLNRAGDYTEALACLKRLQDINLNANKIWEFHHCLGFSLAHSRSQTERDKALFHLQKAIVISNSHFTDYANIPGFITIGYVYSQNGEYDTADEYYQRALKVLEDTTPSTAMDTYLSIIYNNIGTNMIRLGRYDSAATFHEKSLTIRKRIFGNVCHPLIAANIYSLGAIYMYLGEYKKANEFNCEYNRMEQFLSGVRVDLQNYYKINNQGLIRMKYDFDNHMALDMFREALKMYTEVGETNHANVTIYNNMGYASKNLGLFEKAEEYYTKALAEIEPHISESRRTDILSLNARLSHNMGVLLMVKSAFERAQPFLENAFRLRSELTENKTMFITESYLILLSFMKGAMSWNDCVKSAETALAKHIEAFGQKENWDHVLVLNNLGQLCRGAGRHTEAIGHHQNSLEICRKCYKTVSLSN